MSFEKDFLDCLPSDITVHATSTIDGYGKPTHVTVGSTFKGLIQGEQKLVRSFDGSEQVAHTSVLMACSCTINPTDKITLPDGTDRPILAIDTLSDSSGQHHIEVFFGGQSKAGR